jgi:hypothetical protein
VKAEVGLLDATGTLPPSAYRFFGFLAMSALLPYLFNLDFEAFERSVEAVTQLIHNTIHFGTRHVVARNLFARAIKQDA